MRKEIKQLEVSYRLLDKLGLQQQSVEASNAMCDLMQVDEMLTDRIESLESYLKRSKVRRKK